MTKELQSSRYIVILFENQIQTTSASPYRTQVQLAASFLVCFLIFIEYQYILAIEKIRLSPPNLKFFHHLLFL